MILALKSVLTASLATLMTATLVFADTISDEKINFGTDKKPDIVQMRYDNQSHNLIVNRYNTKSTLSFSSDNAPQLVARYKTGILVELNSNGNGCPTSYQWIVADGPKTYNLYYVIYIGSLGNQVSQRPAPPPEKQVSTNIKNTDKAPKIPAPTPHVEH